MPVTIRPVERQTSHTLIATLLLSLLMLQACASAPRHVITVESAEEAEEFRSLLRGNGAAVLNSAQRTEKGENLSEMSVDWMVLDILIALAAHDDELYHHFYAKGQDVQGYLKTTFTQNPQQEIDAITLMSEEMPSTLRSAAVYALEALRHIPDPHQPKSDQLKDRSDLAAALHNLQRELEVAADEIEAPSS